MKNLFIIKIILHLDCAWVFHIIHIQALPESPYLNQHQIDFASTTKTSISRGKTFIIIKNKQNEKKTAGKESTEESTNSEYYQKKGRLYSNYDNIQNSENEQYNTAENDKVESSKEIRHEIQKSNLTNNFRALFTHKPRFVPRLAQNVKYPMLRNMPSVQLQYYKKRNDYAPKSFRANVPYRHYYGRKPSLPIYNFPHKKQPAFTTMPPALLAPGPIPMPPLNPLFILPPIYVKPHANIYVPENIMPQINVVTLKNDEKVNNNFRVTCGDCITRITAG